MLIILWIYLLNAKFPTNILFFGSDFLSSLAKVTLKWWPLYISPFIFNAALQLSKLENFTKAFICLLSSWNSFLITANFLGIFNSLRIAHLNLELRIWPNFLNNFVKSLWVIVLGRFPTKIVFSIFSFNPLCFGPVLLFGLGRFNVFSFSSSLKKSFR